MTNKTDKPDKLVRHWSSFEKWIVNTEIGLLMVNGSVAEVDGSVADVDGLVAEVGIGGRVRTNPNPDKASGNGIFFRLIEGDSFLRVNSLQKILKMY